MGQASEVKWRSYKPFRWPNESQPLTGQSLSSNSTSPPLFNLLSLQFCGLRVLSRAFLVGDLQLVLVDLLPKIKNYIILLIN